MNQLASLRYLAALHEHKHFGRAAAACHITQPALSNALRALEADFGVVIVRRGRTYAGLTPEGELVLASAQRMLQARHPGITPVVRSLSSPEIETGLDSLALDMGLGYTERTQGRGPRLATLPQYTEHYFLLRRGRKAGGGLQIGPTMAWAEAARLPLCLLTPEMHNRSVVDQAFATAGTSVRPAIETNSITALALAVLAGEVCSVMPGALVGTLRGEDALEALPLEAPQVLTPIGFLLLPGERFTRTQQAAMALATDAQWLATAAAHSGRLG